MTQRLTLVATLVMTALAAAVPAFAQQPAARTPRPNRHLFGSGVGNTSQLLTLDLRLGGTFDQDLRAGGLPPTADVTANGGLNYSLSQQFGKLDLGVAAGSWAYYYPLVSDDVIFNHRASLSAAFAFSQHSTLSVNQWFTYAPYNMRAFYPQGLAVQSNSNGQPGLPPAYDPAYGLNSYSYLNSGTSVTFRQQITQRGSLDFAYGRNGNNLTPTGGRLVYQSLRGGFSYALAKGLYARAGYSGNIQGGSASGPSQWRGRSIDGGIDFNRALSISRSTTLAFGTGVTGVYDEFSQRYFVTGNARLNHEIGRSWTATVAYYRDVQYFDGYTDPLLGDSLTFDLRGVLGRRWAVDSSAGARRGQFGISAGAADFSSSYVRAGTEYAITRNLALRADYAYFKYGAGVGAASPIGIRSRMERQSLRLTLNLWAPLLAHTRRP